MLSRWWHILTGAFIVGGIILAVAFPPAALIGAGIAAVGAIGFIGIEVSQWIDQLETQISNQNVQINQLSSQIQNQQQSIAQIQVALATINQNITAIQSELTQLSTKVTAQEAPKIAQLQQQLTQLQQSVAILQVPPPQQPSQSTSSRPVRNQPG